MNKNIEQEMKQYKSAVVVFYIVFNYLQMDSSFYGQHNKL